MVAVPTLMTAAVLTPARMTGSASGRSTTRVRWDGVKPSARAASRRPAGTCSSPTMVLRTIGSSAYTANVISAGTTPIDPTTGISIASSASDGIVCSTPTMARIGCLIGRRAAMSPSGTPSRTATPVEMPTSARWRWVRRHRSSVSCVKNPRVGVAAGTSPWPARNCRATCENDLPSSSTAAFMAIMSSRWMRRASAPIACHCAACRRATSAR